MRYLAYLVMSVSLVSCSIISSTPVLSEIVASKGDIRPFEMQLPVNTAHKKLAFSYTSTVGIKEDGTVWSWGTDYDGSLGNGGLAITQYTPTPIQGMTDFDEVVGDEHFLALRKDGTVWAWGDNHYGQLGYKTEKSYSNKPKQVIGLNNIISVAAGRNYSLVLDKQGVVYLSGSSRQWKMNVDETKTKQFTLNFIPILKYEKAIKVIAKGGYALLMQADGKVIYCCDGTVKEFPNNVVDVALTIGETYFLLSNGQLLAENQDNGEYLKQGDIKTVDSNTKTVKAKNIGRVKAITTNYASAFALDEKGRVWEWSYYLHRVEKSNVEPLPILINKFSNAVSLAAGIASAAFLDNGDVYFWGLDTGGVRGTGKAITIPLKNVYTPEKSLWTWK